MVHQSLGPLDGLDDTSQYSNIFSPSRLKLYNVKALFLLFGFWSTHKIRSLWFVSHSIFQHKQHLKTAKCK